MLDCCLEPGKYEGLKMLDLQTKSAINLDNLQVQHQATSQASQITDTLTIYRYLMQGSFKTNLFT
jgi:hypothetical protein